MNTSPLPSKLCETEHSVLWRGWIFSEPMRHVAPWLRAHTATSDDAQHHSK